MLGIQFNTDGFYVTNAEAHTLGMLLRVALYGYGTCAFDGFLEHYYKYRQSPQIAIQCAPDRQNEVSESFFGYLNQYYDNIGQEFFRIELDVKYTANKVMFFLKEDISSYLSDEDCENPDAPDSVIDPFTYAIENTCKTFPDLPVGFAILYHQDIGSNFGYGVLWMGEDDFSSALILEYLLRQERFWNKKIWKNYGFNEGYEKILECMIQLKPFLEEDVFEIFWNHVPENKIQRIKKLQEKLSNK